MLDDSMPEYVTYQQVVAKLQGFVAECVVGDDEESMDCYYQAIDLAKRAERLLADVAIASIEVRLQLPIGTMWRKNFERQSVALLEKAISGLPTMVREMVEVG